MHLIKTAFLVTAFLTVSFVYTTAAHSVEQLTLAPEEEAWLDAHRTIRLGIDPAWPPFSFKNKTGNYVGIDPDFLHLLESRLGIKFEIIPSNSWAETYDKLIKGEIDVVSGISHTAERDKILLFTDAYLSFPIAIIMRNDAPFLLDTRDLKNKKFASPRGYVITERVQTEYPGSHIERTDTLEEALRLVSLGKQDVVIENLAAVSHLIKVNGLTNLKIAGLTDYTLDLRLAVRKDWPQLVPILQKGLNSISDDEQHQIHDRWITVPDDSVINKKLVVRVIIALLLAGLAIGAYFLLWNRRLARELEERRKIEAQLKIAHDRLASLNDEKSHFMDMAMHDLNNPLTSIVGYCDYLKTLLPEGSPEYLSKSLMEMDEAAQRMVRMIRILLNARAIEEGAVQLQPVSLDLSDLGKRIIDSFRRSAEKKNIVLNIEECAPDCKIHGDPDAVAQIIENLVSNAIKFTPPGGAVNMEIQGTPSHVRLKVTDNGPGVLQAEMPRLFDKFARLSAKPTGNESSTGLGLCIVKQLVEAMQGRIYCESQPGNGTSFIVEFPREQAFIQTGAAI